MRDIKLRTYLRGFFSDWLTGMSGPLSVPLAVLALWVSSGGQRVLWGCLAVMSAVFATYRVWRKERVDADGQIADLKKEVELLKHRPYDEEHRRLAEGKVGGLSEVAKDLIYFLLHHGKTEAEQLRKHCWQDPEFNAALQAAREQALVHGIQEQIPGRAGVQYFWEINPQFEAVLRDLLGKRNAVFFR